jgi:hypothetical protein
MLQSRSETILMNTSPKRSKMSRRLSEETSFPTLPEKERTEVENLIGQLQNELKIKESVIASLENRIDRLDDESSVVKRHHPISTVTHMVSLIAYLLFIIYYYIKMIG